jgi:formylglycine-generating enzyme required for sulfatase activity
MIGNCMRSRLWIFGGLALVLLLLLACNLTIATPIATPDATPDATTGGLTSTDQVVVTETSLDVFPYQPGIGSTVLWADQSYVVFVPAGDFAMGQDEDTPSDHTPQHTVYLDAFWIHQTEVTNRIYAACVDAGICTVPYHTSGKPNWYAIPQHANDPVVGVSWTQAATYCEWIEGRLPTEAEWEKAARGLEGDPYPWSDETPTCDLLNFGGCQETDQPVRVRSFFNGASPFQLADMAGNVSEWVQDWYNEEYYGNSPVSNPVGPADGTQRVVRGSSYNSLLEQVPVYLREKVNPNEHRAEVGFRCVLTGETVGNPPPPVCEVAAYIPGTVPDHPIDLYPPEFISSSFCMMDSEGDSQGYVALQFPGPIDPFDYTYISDVPGVVFTSMPDDHTVSLFGSSIPLDTNFEVTICTAEAPDLPFLEAECPPDYYFDPDTNTCRYGTPALHDTPSSCNIDELFIPGYGCLHACDSGTLLCACPLGYDFYEGYTPPGLPGEFTLCVPPDGPEECLTDPNCSVSNTCLAGLTYDPEGDCCELPADVTPYCPPLYTLKISEIGATCTPPELVPLCTSFPVYIPNCDIPVQLQCANPGSFGSQPACEAAACRWVRPSSQPKPYCTYP